MELLEQLVQLEPLVLLVHLGFKALLVHLEQLVLRDLVVQLVLLVHLVYRDLLALLVQRVLLELLVLLEHLVQLAHPEHPVRPEQLV
jgi:hypothetical protein